MWSVEHMELSVGKHEMASSCHILTTEMIRNEKWKTSVTHTVSNTHTRAIDTKWALAGFVTILMTNNSNLDCGLF